MPKLRVEFRSLGSGRGRLGGQVDVPYAEPLGSLTLEVGAEPTDPGNRPVVPNAHGTVFASLLAVEEGVFVGIGSAPDPGSEPRILLLPGRPQLAHVVSGQVLSAMLADFPYAQGPGAITPADRSGSVTTAETAQEACPANPGRRYLLVANPDETRTFWFATGGTATTGPSSIQVGPGGAFVFDRLVPSGAVSIIAPSAGQPFTVQEA